VASLLLFVQPSLVFLALCFRLLQQLCDLFALDRVFGLKAVSRRLNLSEAVLDQRQLRFVLARVLLSQIALELSKTLFVFDLQRHELLPSLLGSRFCTSLVVL
jgi:hypothetical protein